MFNVQISFVPEVVDNLICVGNEVAVARAHQAFKDRWRQAFKCQLKGLRAQEDLGASVMFE